MSGTPYRLVLHNDVPRLAERRDCQATQPAIDSHSYCALSFTAPRPEEVFEKTQHCRSIATAVESREVDARPSALGRPAHSGYIRVLDDLSTTTTTLRARETAISKSERPRPPADRRAGCAVHHEGRHMISMYKTCTTRRNSLQLQFDMLILLSTPEYLQNQAILRDDQWQE